MKTTFLSLKTRDFLKSLILFVGAPVLYELQKLVPGYNLPPLITVGISAAIAYLLKNLFTDDTKTAQKIVDENGKKIVDKSARIVPIILALIAFSFAANAQKFYSGKMPKPVESRSVIAGAPAEATTQNIFGPVANIMSYTLPDNALLTGAGFGYKHMKFDPKTEEWGEVWSFNALAWDKISLAGNPNAFAYGLALGVSPGLISPKLESPYKILLGAATTNITRISNLFGTLGVTMPINR